MSLLSLVSSMSSLVGTIGPKFVSIGKSAIQAFKDIGQFFHDKLIQPIKDAVDGLGENWTAFKEMVGGVFTSIGETAGAILGTLFDLLQEIPSVFTLEFWTGLFESISETVGVGLVRYGTWCPTLPLCSPSNTGLTCLTLTCPVGATFSPLNYRSG